MDLMIFALGPEATSEWRRCLILFEDLLLRIWRRKACEYIILPVPVTLNLFFDELCVFCLGMFRFLLWLNSALFRGKIHYHVSSLNLGRLLNLSALSTYLCELIHKRIPLALICHFTSAELNKYLDAVPIH